MKDRLEAYYGMGNQSIEDLVEKETTAAAASEEQEK